MASPQKTPSVHPLQVCFTILQGLGKPGEYVWITGKEIADMNARVSYLREAIFWLRAKAKHNAKTGLYRELPVNFTTFVNCPMLLNKAGVLWPMVVSEGEKINSGRYVECVLTGGIGVAKTTLAIYSQAYQVYVLSCTAEPHKLFDLDPSSEILIVFQSINKNLAQDVDYKRFKDMVLQSPYFSSVYPFDTSRESEMRFPRNVIVKPVAGHDTAAIGQNVIGGIIDEVNFMAIVEDSKQVKGSGTYDQATQNYNSIARRRESRFMAVGGGLPGILCLVSSRNYPGQFTDKKEAEARTNPRIYIYDKRIWEIRPERFGFRNGVRSPEMIELWGPDYPWQFNVFVGDETRKPRLLDADDDVPVNDRHLVMSIPIEYRKTFDNDLLAALRDVAGVATQAMHPFMLNTDAIADCFGKTLHIVSRDSCDFASTKVQLYPKRFVNKQEPRFCHIDLSTAKDSTGVSIGHVPGFMQVNRGEYVEELPIIQFDMVLEVLPPRGGEIEPENIRRLLYTLRDRMKMPIKWVSFDDFQSKDSMQLLHAQGFIVGSQSMDTDTRAYDMTKQAFYDRRLRLPHQPKAQKEMVTLEYDAKKGKVDHPPTSSKDLADSIAGVVIGLTMRREIWVRHGVSSHKIAKTLAVDTDKGQSKHSISAKERRREREPA